MSDNSMTVTANPIPIDMDIGTVVAPNPNAPREFIITIWLPEGQQAFTLDRTEEEIWSAFRRKDTIWFQIGKSTNGQQAIQRAVITDNGFDDFVNPSQMTAAFAGNFGRGWGFYNVYYVSGIGLVVNFHGV